MNEFSVISEKRLSSCDERLQRLMREVIKGFDCTVLCGHRSKEEQNAAVKNGNSKTQWPRSRHNSLPAQAVDVCPYPVDWDDRERMVLFAGYVMGVAFKMGIALRWGGDWNCDTQTRDNRFDDLVHFELA